MVAPLDDPNLLVAEREAVLRPFERLLRARGIAERDIPARLAYTCLTLSVEAWRRVHPGMDEEEAAQLFGAMAAEAMRAFSDARVVMAGRRNLQEGKTHA